MNAAIPRIPTAMALLVIPKVRLALAAADPCFLERDFIDLQCLGLLSYGALN